jgi:tyrosyl-tRNA synthetase
MHPLLRGAVDVVERESLEAALAAGKRLRVKLGIDPTAPDLHLGHAVLLRKLRSFQDAGHAAVLIIGDFTATIGDPSGKSAARPPLTESQVRDNMRAYLAQAGKILDTAALEVRRNSEWLGDSFRTILSLLRAASVQQALHRADFAKRMEEGNEISIIELVYPLLQGYDSVAIGADLELGGTDQLFNVLMGRQVQKEFGKPAQHIATMPLLEGTDGVRKMSKSAGNYIALADAPADMYGKIMSVPDALMPKYFELLTDLSFPHDLPPREAKGLLARTIVAWLHGAEEARTAEEAFIKQFAKKETPEDAPELRITDNGLGITELLTAAGVKSKSEARRLIEQGGVSLDGAPVTDPGTAAAYRNGSVLQIGKRHFFKIVLT